MTDFPLDLEALHRMRRAAWVTWAERYLRERADAEDAVDTAVVKIFDNWATILRSDNPHAYAWTIVRNTVIDYARSRGHRPMLLDGAAFDTIVLRTALDPFHTLPDVMLLFSAIADLAEHSERQHDAFVLRHCQGHSFAEIAEILGTPVATVRSNERHARRYLREALGPYLREGEHP